MKRLHPSREGAMRCRASQPTSRTRSSTRRSRTRACPRSALRRSPTRRTRRSTVASRAEGRRQQSGWYHGTEEGRGAQGRQGGRQEELTTPNARLPRRDPTRTMPARRRLQLTAPGKRALRSPHHAGSATANTLREPSASRSPALLRGRTGLSGRCHSTRSLRKFGSRVYKGTSAGWMGVVRDIVPLGGEGEVLSKTVSQSAGRGTVFVKLLTAGPIIDWPVGNRMARAPWRCQRQRGGRGRRTTT